MELKIDWNYKEPKKNDYYEVVVRFMEGDADGEETLHFGFRADRLLNKAFEEEFHDFLRSIQSCINRDSYGRGGFEESYEAAEWYGKGIKYGKKVYQPCYQWSRFCRDSDYWSRYPKPSLDLDPLQPDSIFQYYIPTYDQGWYDSYVQMELHYYDIEGDKYPVIIEYNEEDKKLINYKF